MKRYITFLFIGPLLLMMFIAQVSAQTHWTKYSGNPVLDPGPSGNWDDAHISWPFVIYDGTQFIMYYTGFPEISPEGGQGGRATSHDGINWTRDEGNPVLKVGLEGEWDDATVFPGPVIFDGSEYKMWYTGYDGTQWRIGIATSIDGIDWIKYEGNPVFDIGDSGNWDDSAVTASTVLVNESGYKMWYGGWESGTRIWRVGYATSSDGIIWERHAENPVLDVGESGEWDDEDIGHGYVILNGNTYEMWYQGYNGSIERTGYATSPDGIKWTKYENNPILVPESGWEAQGAAIGSVLLYDSEYRMWYMGHNSSSGRIGYATAPVTIYVPDQVETIQAAIDSAVDGNLVLVDEGTYYENINFKGKAITVASHFYVDGDTSHISKTIIDGSQHENPDSGSVVYFVSGEDTNSVLCGFTITGGAGTKGYWNDDIHWYGGGVFCASGGRIINNIVRDNAIDVNVVYAGGGGILAGWWGTAYVIIQGNTIMSNSVENVDAAGGGISFYCNGKITDNRVAGNTATATGGWSAGGGMNYTSQYVTGKTTIYNNIIVYNEAINGNGGGISFGSELNKDALLINNTIAFNKADAYGGGIATFNYPTGVMFNSIIWGNQAQSNSQIYPGDGSTLDVLYSDIQEKVILIRIHTSLIPCSIYLTPAIVFAME
jgi:predicted GH43/DUF377 family glycosyl hydrolase